MEMEKPFEVQKTAVLVVDDDELSVDTLKRALKKEFDVYTATSAAQAWEILKFEYIQVVISDHMMPEETGVEFLTRVRDEWSDIVRIIISGYSNHADTIRSVNEAGIYHYIEKPWEPEKVIMTIHSAAKLYELQRENHLLSLELKVAPDAIEKQVKQKRQALGQSYNCDNIVRSQGGVVDGILKKVCQIAEFDFPVLVTGNSGTGKELVARAMHYNSMRGDKPFVAENCGALPDQLLESELFGHKKGAFTGAYTDHVGLFEQANGGTLFLDEVGELSSSFQVKLLRVLQEQEIRPLGHTQPRKVDVRVIAATNRNLEEEVKAGRFREDLLYRLAGYVVHLPDLSERTEDITLLAEHFLKKFCQAYDRENHGFEPAALACMQQYHWQGNIRELQNEISRMFMFSPPEGSLKAEFLSPKVLRATPEEMEMEMHYLSGVSGSLKDKVEAMEKQFIKESLIRLKWNKSKVAEELGLSRVGLRKKIDRYGIEEVFKEEIALSTERVQTH